jgi:mRNA-degrading endonuclease RelE of RelBE toxin-antitoxin system
MEYKITQEGIKTLSRLPKTAQKKILDKLDFIFATKDPLKLSKRLNGYEFGDYRIRIGDYRASFDVVNNLAKFLKFGHRKDIYK